MERNYKVLWIDDEWDRMPTFKSACEKLHRIELVPYRTCADGMAALHRDLYSWDAVLLDAKILDESENESPRLTGLSKAIAELNALKSRRFIPRFISTGQPDLMNDKTFSEFFGKFYIKGDDDDSLIEDMLSAIQNSSRGQIEGWYDDVMAAMRSLEMPNEARSILIDTLLPLHFPAEVPEFNPQRYYNGLRRFLEYLFRACNRCRLLPDCFVKNGSAPNLNQSSLYLSGEEAGLLGVRYGKKGERIFEDYIEKIVFSIIAFGNINSHTADISKEDDLKLDKAFRSANSRFLIFGFALQLCEVTIWLADFVRQHEGEDFLGKCVSTVGCPEFDEDLNMWHLGECLILLKEEDWKSGKQLRLCNVQTNTNVRTNGKYPYFAHYTIV